MSNDTDSGLGDDDGGFGSMGHDAGDANDPGAGGGDDTVGGWEASVAERGYAAGYQDASEASPGASAEMSEILGWTEDKTSANLASQFGFAGVVEAIGRYGFATGIIGALTALAPTMVEQAVEHLAMKLNMSIVSALAVSNPALAVAIGIIGIFGVDKLGTMAHDAALGGNATMGDIGGIMGERGGDDGSTAELYQNAIDAAGIGGMRFRDFVSTYITPTQGHIPNAVYRRRSNIIGTGRRGLTIE